MLTADKLNGERKKERDKHTERKIKKKVYVVALHVVVVHVVVVASCRR